MIFKTKWSKKKGIYCIKNIITNKSYVGSSINLLTRLQKHRSFLRGKIHENSYLQNSWNKHGEECFIAFILEYCEESQLLEKEQFWVDKLGHYNIIKDVIRHKMSEESKIKMSNTRKLKIASGKIPKFNCKKIKKYDLEGNFIKEYNTITSASLENNISSDQIARVLKKTCWTAGNFQWKYSIDQSEITKVKKRNYKAEGLKRYIPLIVFDTFTGIFYEFKSFIECKTFFDVSSTVISTYFKNKNKKLYRGRYLIEKDLKKQEELLGTPITVCEDNQQPSLESNLFEGSTTNTRIQTSNVEDSNGNTSILLNT